jgi:hypothetical protein
MSHNGKKSLTTHGCARVCRLAATTFSFPEFVLTEIRNFQIPQIRNAAPQRKIEYYLRLYASSAWLSYAFLHTPGVPPLFQNVTIRDLTFAGVPKGGACARSDAIIIDIIHVYVTQTIYTSRVRQFVAGKN